ncbi:unnamed protein product [Pseudo-nitzschia multistriata]|uniref:Uncharacterized protein n=1 Tax=Pseudo-nitzschia multistriata TaxID=183589 RepID=A0A448YXL3_9STRA|nr:unnamed protein product [Pseudo-nitzschia multistriata]
MNSSGNNNGYGRGGDGHAESTTGTKEQQQPVVSLLEKYSSLHRGIDEARKEYAEKQMEIESIEGKIHRLVSVDGPETEAATEKAIQERDDLLRTLEELTTKDLVDAQDREFRAQTKLALARSKEEKAIQAAQDDQTNFLLECKTFREKIRTLILRGELYDFKSRLAPIGAHIILGGNHTVFSGSQREDDTKNGTGNDSSENFQLLCDLLLQEANKNNDNYEEDEELQELLQQLRTQKEKTKKSRQAWEEATQKLSSAQQAMEKRENQKKDLQSQCERLEKDVFYVQSQIDCLDRLTKEAHESAADFRNDMERHAQKQSSSSITTPLAPERTTVTAEAGAQTTAGNHCSSANAIRKKQTAPYNPYAVANRKRHTASASASTSTPELTGTSRTISPVAALDTTDKNNGNHPHRAPADGNGDRSSFNFSPNSLPSGQRLRSSRHFGRSSFRPPGESLMRIAASASGNGNTSAGHNKIEHRNDNAEFKPVPSESTKVSPWERRGPKRGTSSKRLRIDDSDDDDSEENGDDSSWLNAAPAFSAAKKSKSSASESRTRVEH